MNDFGRCPTCGPAPKKNKAPIPAQGEANVTVDQQENNLYRSLPPEVLGMIALATAESLGTPATE